MLQLPGGYTPEIWQYSYQEGDDVKPFGDTTTYEMGLSWLYETCDTVQDWGAGPAYGRRLCPEGKSYLAVDGSPTSAGLSDVTCELTDWHPEPKPAGIFMRHVLEHNEFGWDAVLRNAVASFTKRFCLVTFTPFAMDTRRLRPAGDPYCDLAFCFSELTAYFDSLRWYAKGVETQTQYGGEMIFYVEPF